MQRGLLGSLTTSNYYQPVKTTELLEIFIFDLLGEIDKCGFSFALVFIHTQLFYEEKYTSSKRSECWKSKQGVLVSVKP